MADPILEALQAEYANPWESTVGAQILKTPIPIEYTSKQAQNPWIDIGSQVAKALIGGLLAGYGQQRQEDEVNSAIEALAGIEANNPTTAAEVAALRGSTVPGLAKIAPIVQRQALLAQRERQTKLQDMLAEKQLDYALQIQNEPALGAAKKAAEMQVEIANAGKLEAIKQGVANMLNPGESPAAKATDALRKEWQGFDVVKQAETASQLLKSMEASAAVGGKYGDLDFLGSAKSVLDLTSGGARDSGMINAVVDLYNRINGGGEGLKQEDRQAIYDIVQNRLGAALQVSQAKRAQMEVLARQRGGDPAMVTGPAIPMPTPYALPKAADPAAAAPTRKIDPRIPPGKMLVRYPDGRTGLVSK